MAKKKRPTSKRTDQKQNPPDLMLPDRRALERVMREVAAGLGGERVEETPLDRAQEVMYQAFEAAGAEQVRLARKALEISPDCADAHVLLAEHAETAEEARKHFEQGVAAGERVLGKQAFEEYVGQFWGVLETRPYMRPAGPGAMPVGSRPSGRGGRTLPGVAPAQSQRQPGRSLLPGHIAVGSGPRRGSPPAPGEVRGRRLGGVGLHQDPAGVPGAGRITAGQQAAGAGSEGQQARSGLLAGAQATAPRPAALHQHGRRGRGRQLRGRQSPRLARIRRGPSPGCGRRSTCRCPSRPSAGGLRGPNCGSDCGDCRRTRTRSGRSTRCPADDWRGTGCGSIVLDDRDRQPCEQ